MANSPEQTDYFIGRAGLTIPVVDESFSTISDVRRFFIGLHKMNKLDDVTVTGGQSQGIALPSSAPSSRLQSTVVLGKEYSGGNYRDAILAPPIQMLSRFAIILGFRNNDNEVFCQEYVADETISHLENFDNRLSQEGRVVHKGAGFDYDSVVKELNPEQRQAGVIAETIEEKVQASLLNAVKTLAF